MAGGRGDHHDVPLAPETVGAPQLRQARVAAPHHAGEGVGVEALPAQGGGGLRKGADGQVRLPGLQPRLQRAGVERQGAQAQLRPLGLQPPHQHRHGLDHAHLGDQDGELPVRAGRIEVAGGRPQQVRRREQAPERLQQLLGLGSRAHGQPDAHQQGIAEVCAQPAQHLAQRGLADPKALGGAGEAAHFQQQHQGGQVAEADVVPRHSLTFIPNRNSIYSPTGMASILSRP